MLQYTLLFPDKKPDFYGVKVPSNNYLLVTEYSYDERVKLFYIEGNNYNVRFGKEFSYIFEATNLK